MSMPSEIIVALCSLAGTLFGSLFGVLQASRLTAHRIEQLEKKMDKHNGLVERMALCEREDKAQWKKIDDHESRLRSVEDAV